MNKKKTRGIVCACVVIVGAMLWMVMTHHEPPVKLEERVFLIDVFHWGFITADSNSPDLATNSLNEYGMPTTTIQVTQNDIVTIVFRNAEHYPSLREKYQPWMDLALANAGLTKNEWETLKEKTPLYRGYLITIDCYCGVVDLREDQSSVTLSFIPSGAGVIGFRAINTIEMVQMDGNIIIV